MNDELSVLLLNDGRLGKRVHFKGIGDIGVIIRVFQYTDGYEEFTVDLGNFCRLQAGVTHFELMKVR
jgi:hypothetical protein